MSDHNPGLRPWRDIARRECRQIMVGNVPVGGGAPISVQTMTNTLTSDAVATIDQIRRCEDAGADLIRVSCPDVERTAALGKIVRASRIPIIADIRRGGDDRPDSPLRGRRRRPDPRLVPRRRKHRRAR